MIELLLFRKKIIYTILSRVGDLVKRKFIFIIPFILYLIFISNVKATVDGGGAATGGGGTSNTGNWCVNASDTCSGIRITITNGSRNENNKESKCSFELDRNALKKAGFDNHEKWWNDRVSLNSTYLYDFLNIPYGEKTGDYSKLRDLISGCNISDGDYIYIEPFASQNNKKKTLHDILISGVGKDGSIYKSLANAAATGKKVGSYDSVNKSCDYGDVIKYCGVRKYGGSGYGVLELRASDLIQSNTMKVTKLVNGKPQNGVTFKLVSRKDNSTQVKTTNINGVVEFQIFKDTTYNLYEVITRGYVASEALLEYEETFGGGSENRKKPTGIDGGNPYWTIMSTYVDRNIKIINKATCQAMFEQLSNKNDMQQRIKLYNSMLEEGKNFTNILNLNITNASQACSAAVCNIETCSGCLSSSVGYNTEFNSRNLSCYNEIRDGLYCFNSFELSNSLNSNIFSINQGGVLLKNVSITGALTTSCYGGYANSTFRYSDYIKELKIENAPNSKKLSTGDIIRSTSFKDNLFTTKLTTNYNLPSVYASILSGKASYEDCDNRRFLGYGIITKFIEENGTFNGTFSSKLKIDNKKFNVNADTLKGDCTYYSTPELIDNGGLNLEFRIIDTGNPFPGKSGSNNRKVGLNWCDEDNCTQDNNTLITKYIKDANNSYNKNKEAQPKYKITLSSSDIKVIKEYNKKAEAYGGYDDNTLNCNDENNCSSTFIEGLKSGILKYYVDGNRNSEEYIGNMLNRLIINK